MTASILHNAHGLTSKRRRAAEKLAEQVDLVLESDRRFFERRPGRDHRIRLAAIAEIETGRLVGEMKGGDPGYRWFVAVRQFAPGVRVRIFFGAPEGNDPDVSEVEARWLYRTEISRQPIALDADRQMERLALDLKARTGTTGRPS